MELGEEVLLAIAEIKSRSDSFPGFHQVSSLQSRFGFSLQEASAHLRMADHLSHSAVQKNLGPEQAADEIVAVASEIHEPVRVEERQRTAIAAILSADFGENPPTARLALASGPHFIGIEGFWSLRPVKTSSDNILAVPIVSLNISWHDHSGAPHEAFIQLSEADWQEFRDKVTTIEDLRKDLEPFQYGASNVIPNPSEDQ